MKNFETEAIRLQTEQTQHREHSTPLFITSSFTFEDAAHAEALFADAVQGNIYTRFSNPNTSELIEKMCALEGTEAGIATATGMAAMFVSMAAFLRSGDHLLASRSLFGSTHQIITQILPRWGISYTYVDIQQPHTWEAAIQPNTKMIFAETPSNPGLDLIDLEWLGALARKHHLILNIDNCFCTPYLQTPARWGADIVTHSATKFIDGQGRVLGGLILGRADLIQEVRFFARHTGPALSPFNSWLLSKSLETLAVRMDRHCSNALALAQWLEAQPEVNWVKYPLLPSHPQHTLALRQMRAGGGMVSFEIKGGIEAVRRVLNNLKMLSHTSNLGDTRSIATSPVLTTHSKLSPDERAAVGISDGLIRISVGLEHIDDIKQDLAQAFRA